MIRPSELRGERTGALVLASLAFGLILGGCGDAGTPRTGENTGSGANAPPVAALTVSCSQLRCNFADASSDNDGTIKTRVWNFGDDFTLTDIGTPIHTYAAPGAYTVTLTIADDDGATSSHSELVAVNVPPRASFDFSCAGLVCAFTDGSTDFAGSIVYRRWNFGDETPPSMEPNPTHTYASAGTFSVTLTVIDDGGESTTATRSISVIAPPTTPPGTPPPPPGETLVLPTAAFDVSCSSLTCTFSDRSVAGAGTLSGWAWTFGDDAVSADRNPQHVYVVGALTEFTVQLTVTDTNGARAVASKSFTVSPAAVLQWRDASNPGELVDYTITLDRAATIQIQVIDRECMAVGNTFTVTKPSLTTLFTDGCYDPPVGTTFTISDNGKPFPAGTVFAAQMLSGAVKQVIPPTLVVTGTTSPWQIVFDDGMVAPRDLDIRLEIRLSP